MQLVIILLIILIFVAFGVLVYIVEYAFKMAFTKYKKTEMDAYEYLKAKKILDKEIYNEVKREDVFIKSKDNLNLKGYLIEKYKNSNKYMILVHGFTGNNHIHMPFVRFFLSEGFNVLVVDQRNHGDSEGKYPSYGYFEREDIDRWIDFLYKRVGKEIFLGLHGQSMGGATVLMCGSRNEKVDFIIEDCGYSNAEEEIKTEISKTKNVPVNLIYSLLRIKAKIQVGFDIKDAVPINDIKKCDKPIMFIHGNEDNVVPYHMAINMYNARNNKNDILYIVEGADHMWAYPKEKREYERKVHEFIANVEKIKKFG